MWGASHTRRGRRLAPPGREDDGGGFVETVDAIERVPCCIERPRMSLGMLEGERGKRLPVTAAPRFLAGVVQRQQLVEPTCAGVIGVRILAAAFRTLMHSASVREAYR